jgi:hypothetical protein
MKTTVSKKWGPHWPQIGKEHITPVLAPHGFEFSSMEFDDGFIYWKKRTDRLFNFEIDVHPHTSVKSRQCGFSGALCAKSDEVDCLLSEAGFEQITSTSVVLMIPLAWIVRRANPSVSRAMWEISYDDPVASLEVFSNDMSSCLSPMLALLGTEPQLIDYALNADKYSNGVKGGPSFGPMSLLKVSALCYVVGDKTNAQRYLGEYETYERAYLHRSLGLPNEKQKLEQLLASRERLIGNLRRRYERS